MAFETSLSSAKGGGCCWVHRFWMVMKNKPKFIPQHALAINARVCSIKNVFMLSEINRKVETTTAGKETTTTSAKLVVSELSLKVARNSFFNKFSNFAIWTLIKFLIKFSSLIYYHGSSVIQLMKKCRLPYPFVLNFLMIALHKNEKAQKGNNILLHFTYANASLFM